MSSETIQWSGATIVGGAMNYTRMVTLLTDVREFPTIIMDLLQARDSHAFVQCIASFCSSAGTILPLIKLMLRMEFQDDMHRTTLLRSNSFASKMLGAYTQIIGKEYLRQLLGDLVKEVVSNEHLSMEIQISKLLADPLSRPSSEEELQQILSRNQELLLNTAKIFVERIVDPSMLKAMPMELKAIAKYIADCAKEKAIDNFAPLVGGFIVLRFISPAIVSPDTYDVLQHDCVPGRRARRNLVLIAKFLQNCSNGVLYGSKEGYMTCLNQGVEQCAPIFAEYFKEVVENPGVADLDVFVTANAERKNRGIDILQFDLVELFHVHAILDRYKEAINQKIASSSFPSQLKQQLSDMLGCLGPAPIVYSRDAKDSLSRHLPISKSLIYSEDMGSNVDSEERQHVQEDLMSAEMAVLEKAGFLYTGPPAKDGCPVLYIIVNRFKFEFLENVDVLINYVFKVMQPLVQSRYIVVVDMSWTRISSEMKREVYIQLSKLSNIMEHSIRKNLERVFVVHPSAYTRAVLMFMRQFTSKKLKNKIQEVYNWKDLVPFISEESIVLPESSKDFITKAYNVVKINNKGKSQKRIIKFTSNSLLNIDPKTKRIQNEKKLNEILQLSAFTRKLEIQILFQTKEKKRASGGAGDVRRYLFNSAQERDEVLLDIFSIGFMSAGANIGQDFKVDKINKRGRHQNRVFKLTCDSLLNMDGTYIKSEIPFAGIDYVSLEESNQQVLVMKFKGESHQRKVISKDAVELYRSLLSGMERYNDQVEAEVAREMYVDENT